MEGPPRPQSPGSLSVLYFCPQGHTQKSPSHQKITERFSRNPKKPADEDVAERAFLIQEERIQLRYHCRDDHITASKREFLRRTEVDSKGNKIIMTPDMCISFEVGLGHRGGQGSAGMAPGPSGSPAPWGTWDPNSWFPAGNFISAPWETQELPSGDPCLCCSSENLPPFPPRKTTQQAKTCPY